MKRGHMTFLYATDLHGDEAKYATLLRYARKLDIKLIHLGADILPKGSGLLKIQKKFVNGFLKRFYAECQAEGIKLLAFFGNDDAYTRKRYFRAYGDLLDEKPYEQDGYRFTAYGYVPDYPFGLKTACKWDSKDWRCPERYTGSPVEVGPDGFEDIDDLVIYFAAKGTIEDDLKSMKGGPKSIVSIHCPPDGLGLDVVPTNKSVLLFDAASPRYVETVKDRRVGSAAVHEWIRKKEPRLVLCGHIHESPEATGVWKAQVGQTLVIQPGQERRKTVFVAIEIDDEHIHAERFTPDI